MCRPMGLPGRGAPRCARRSRPPTGCRRLPDRDRAARERVVGRARGSIWAGRGDPLGRRGQGAEAGGDAPARGQDLAVARVEATSPARGRCPDRERLGVGARCQVGEQRVRGPARESPRRAYAVQADRREAHHIATGRHARPCHHHGLAREAHEPDRARARANAGDVGEALKQVRRPKWTPGLRDVDVYARDRRPAARRAGLAPDHDRTSVVADRRLQQGLGCAGSQALGGALVAAARDPGRVDGAALPPGAALLPNHQRVAAVVECHGEGLDWAAWGSDGRGRAEGGLVVALHAQQDRTRARRIGPAERGDREVSEVGAPDRHRCGGTPERRGRRKRRRRCCLAHSARERNSGRVALSAEDDDVPPAARTDGRGSVERRSAAGGGEQCSRPAGQVVGSDARHARPLAPSPHDRPGPGARERARARKRDLRCSGARAPRQRRQRRRSRPVRRGRRCDRGRAGDGEASRAHERGARERNPSQAPDAAVAVGPQPAHSVRP